MCPTNQTSATYFIIKGISDVFDLQAPIFLLVLLIYLLTLGGNVTILLLVCLDHHLHTPMYFFLGNLSVVDITSTTVTLHKILISYISGDKTISFLGCMIQSYIFGTLICNELLIMTAMSYDRYVAICNPLRYHMVISHRFCSLLATICWMLGFLEIAPHVVLISSFSFTNSNEINHFLCDILPLLKLTCSDTTLLQLVLFLTVLFHVSFCFSLTFVPYVFIITTILKIRSSTGRRKAFSHLTVIILLYITLICQYLKPTSENSLESDKLFSLFNTAAVPVLNPLIYSLKNKDVKSALQRRLLRKK
ncbi:LOW QUALITY PROTEIN: olfactory receptor 5V1-like [Discoglossus pictus]